MATPMSKQLAAIFAAVSDDRQRTKETQADDRLNRPAAENAIDLSHAIYIREIMAIQNDDIVQRVTEGIVKALVDAIDMLEVMEKAGAQVAATMAAAGADDDRR